VDDSTTPCGASGAGYGARRAGLTGSIAGGARHLADAGRTNLCGRLPGATASAAAGPSAHGRRLPGRASRAWHGSGKTARVGDERVAGGE